MRHEIALGLTAGLLLCCTTLTTAGCEDDETGAIPVDGSVEGGKGRAGGSTNQGGTDARVTFDGGGGSAEADAGSASGGSQLADGGILDSSDGDDAVADGGEADANAADADSGAAPVVSCIVASDKTRAIVPPPGRQIYCAIDLGSNNAKLQTISMEPGQPLGFKTERQCASRLGFGSIVYDSKAQVAKPLPAQQVANLVAVMKEFQGICSLDNGVLVGADATQWARDATNMNDVKRSVKDATALEIEVLTPEAEGRYGYAAATRNSPEKFAIDPGSNSFQLSWWQTGATIASTVSIPFGYVRGATAYYPENTTDTYPVASQKHSADLKSRIDGALAQLTPPSSLALLKQAVAQGSIHGEVFLVGQDGALHLAIRGQLRSSIGADAAVDGAAGTWIDNTADYKARVALEVPVANAQYGEIAAIMAPTEIDAFVTQIVQPSDFLALRTAPIRSIYGERVLSNAALLDTLVKELGLTTVVAVPQEMPAGYILAKVAAMQQ